MTYDETSIKKINKTIKKSIQLFKPPENITVSEWADKYRQLSGESSAEGGRWRTSRTKYLREIMDAFTDSKIKRLVVVASSQVGKTEMLLNMFGYMVDIDPGPAMFVLPKLDTAKDFTKRRVAPTIRDTKRLREKIANPKSRDSSNTMLKKKYPGGMITFTGANSPSDLASVPARYIFGDEIDRWTKDAGGEGDPWGLLEARTTTFYNSKMVEVSTPTIKGESEIEKAFLKGTQEYYCIKCPHCGGFNFIRFENIDYKFSTKVINKEKQYFVESVSYVCPECGCMSEENEIKRQEAKWIAQNPDAYQNGVRSFWINTFISPWKKWDDIVLQFLQAEDDPKKLQVVYNTVFGETWQDEEEAEGEEELLERREVYEAELPDGVLCLTCGVDTQANRLEYEVVGYGREEESWGIKKGVIPGKPDEDSTWEMLDEIIDKTWIFKNGKGLKISLTFVDSGGLYTQDVYMQCRKRKNKRVFAIKGANKADTPFINPPKQTKIIVQEKFVGMTWLYYIGVDSGKEKIMSNLHVKEAGKRYCHFPANEDRGYDEEYFTQLLSERVVYKNNKWIWEKVPGRRRNEALDCRNYANAARYSLNLDFDKIEQKLNRVEQKKEMMTSRKKVRRKEWDEDDW